MVYTPLKAYFGTFSLGVADRRLLAWMLMLGTPILVVLEWIVKPDGLDENRIAESIRTDALSEVQRDCLELIPGGFCGFSLPMLFAQSRLGLACVLHSPV